MAENNSNDYTSVNIKELANDPRFGELNFNEAVQQLEELQKSFIDLDELNYKERLTPAEVQRIDQQKDAFTRILESIRSFNLTQHNASQHNSILQQVTNAYNQTMPNLRQYLVWLWADTENSSKDKKEYQQQLKEVVKLKSETKELVDSLQQEIEKLQSEKAEAESTHGEVAAVKFGKHFESHANEFREQKDSWLKRRNKFFWALMVIILMNAIVYLSLFATEKLNVWPSLKPSELFTIEYGAVKLALLAILSYAIGFCTKNYNICSEQQIVNQHRKNVAETLEDFLSASPDLEAKNEILRSGALAMFKPSSSGHIKHQPEDGPVQEMITKINGVKGR